MRAFCEFFEGHYLTINVYKCIGRSIGIRKEEGIRLSNEINYKLKTTSKLLRIDFRFLRHLSPAFLEATFAPLVWDYSCRELNLRVMCLGLNMQQRNIIECKIREAARICHHPYSLNLKVGT